MPLSISCDDCGKKYSVPDTTAGKRVKCKACGNAFVVPAPPPPPAEEYDDLVFEDDPEPEPEDDWATTAASLAAGPAVFTPPPSYQPYRPPAGAGALKVLSGVGKSLSGFNPIVLILLTSLVLAIGVGLVRGNSAGLLVIFSLGCLITAAGLLLWGIIAAIIESARQPFQSGFSADNVGLIGAQLLLGAFIPLPFIVYRTSRSSTIGRFRRRVLIALGAAVLICLMPVVANFVGNGVYGPLPSSNLAVNRPLRDGPENRVSDASSDGGSSTPVAPAAPPSPAPSLNPFNRTGGTRDRSTPPVFTPTPPRPAPVYHYGPAAMNGNNPDPTPPSSVPPTNPAMPPPAPRNFPQLPAPQIIGDGIRFYDVHLTGTSPGRSTHLWIYIPPGEHGASNVPCVFIAPAGTILLTGIDLSDGDRAEHLPYVDAGFAVVAYSLDGVPTGQTPADIAAAAKQFIDAHGGVDNARTALDYVNGYVPEVDFSRLYAAGHSSAATVALDVTAADRRIKGCCAYCPVVDLNRRIQFQTRNQLDPLVPGLQQFLRQGSPNMHGPELAKKHVLLFASDEDTNVPAIDVRMFDRKLHTAGGTDNIKLLVAPHGDHYNAMMTTGLPAGIEFLKQLDAEIARGG